MRQSWLGETALLNPKSGREWGRGTTVVVLIRIRMGSIWVSCNLKTRDQVQSWCSALQCHQYPRFLLPLCSSSLAHVFHLKLTSWLQGEHCSSDWMRRKEEWLGPARWISKLPHSPGRYIHQLPFAFLWPFLSARELGNWDSLVGTRREWIMVGN